MPGRIRSPGTRKGKRNHLQFRTNVFTRGKRKDKRSETFFSNPLCISKTYLKLIRYQPNMLLAHPFSPLPCSPQPTCGSFHAATGGMLHAVLASPAIQSCPQTASACRPYPQPPLLLTKYTWLLCWISKIKSFSAGSDTSFYLRKIFFNSILCKCSSVFQ